MPTLSQAYTVEHPSRLICYIHPYILTYSSDQRSIHVWMCTEGAAPSYNGKLESNLSEPVEIHLISSNHLITRIVSEDGDFGMHELVIYELPSGKISDRLLLGRFNAAGEGDSSLLGIADDTVVIWRSGGPGNGDERIETYKIAEDGTLSPSGPLYPPENAGEKVSLGRNGNFRGELLYFGSGSLLEMSSDTEFPIGVYLSHWSSNRDSPRYRIFPFASFATPPDHEQWVSHLCTYIRSGTSSVVTAHYEHPFGIAEPNPTTSLRSVKLSTQELNWTIVVEQQTNKLCHLPSYGVILAIGFDPHPIVDKWQSISSLSIIILDEANGSIKGRHSIHLPQYPCSGISRAEGGIEADIMGSPEMLAILFGDGQSVVVPINQFLASGFEPFINDSEHFNTALCSGTKFGIPRNSKERRQKEKGRWAWVDQALFGNQEVVLECRDRGFVVLSLT
ncbi:hypothetical protein CPB84DRAFT_1775458 [Gymnopilus junonius]|uniref:Uncharacterized protein n=1 Tax=Gymnopilus junonius TaxID=109634 RepID=A0A9P5NN74_GYMJU|nr:hypothetical protein CPB84DRAFT_1775458 [Gymnopilus junonius]